jgi:octaprenyl-diphosphate synthase
MNIEQIRDPIADDLQAVNALIRRQLQSDVALINQLAGYIIDGGGKRLRPVTVLLAAQACGYTGVRHIDAAAIIEFIHTATLLHDDVVDESDLRRGRETANAIWGNQASVLVGDFLYSRSFQMMVGIGSMRVMEIMADTTNTIAEGEVMQLLNCNDPDTTEERYMAVIYRKTAKLFEAAAQLGAVLAGRPREEEAGAGPLRAALGHRVPADRRRVGLQRLQRGAGQEHRRRSGRGQAHPAADPRHAPGHARGSADHPHGHRAGRIGAHRHRHPDY